MLRAPLIPNPTAFGLLECSAGVSPAWVSHSMACETPALPEILGGSAGKYSVEFPQGRGRSPRCPKSQARRAVPRLSRRGAGSLRGCGRRHFCPRMGANERECLEGDALPCSHSLAAPLGPSSMCFLATAQCLGCRRLHLRRDRAVARMGMQYKKLFPAWFLFAGIRVIRGQGRLCRWFGSARRAAPTIGFSIESLRFSWLRAFV